MRIGIIGLGWVGTSVAISLLHSGLPRTLLLNDIDADLAEGEAMDLRHGASFYPAADVRTADLAERLDHVRRLDPQLRGIPAPGLRSPRLKRSPAPPAPPAPPGAPPPAW